MERKLLDVVQKFQRLPTTALAVPLGICGQVGTWPLLVRFTKPVAVLVLVLRSRRPVLYFLSSVESMHSSPQGHSVT